MASSFDNENEDVEFENLASLAENIVFRLPGCADVMVRKTIQETYRDFCRRSCCLRRRRLLTLELNQSTIAVAPYYGGIVDSVTYVRYNRRMLGNICDYDVRKGNPPVVCLAPRLVPTEQGCDLPDIEIGFVEIPRMNSERVPSWFIQQYGDAICSGVLYRLMSMTGKAWSDASQAQRELINYENAVNECRARYYGNDAGEIRALPNDELI